MIKQRRLQNEKTNTERVFKVFKKQYTSKYLLLKSCNFSRGLQRV